MLSRATAMVTADPCRASLGMDGRGARPHTKVKPPTRGRLSRSRVSAGNLLLGGCFGFSRVALGVLAPEALDAAGRVHELLLAGKERMASGADFHADVALVGGAGNKRVTAGAMDPNFVVAGMNSCFHVSS